MTTDWVAWRNAFPPARHGSCCPAIARATRPRGESGRRAGRARTRDLRRLSGSSASGRPASDYGAYDIEIIAEINHAPRLPLDAILAEAAAACRRGRRDRRRLRARRDWSGVADGRACARRRGAPCVDRQHEPGEIEMAVRPGRNGAYRSIVDESRHAAADWGAKWWSCPTIRRRSAGWTKRSNFSPAAACRCGSIRFSSRSVLDLPRSLGRYLEVRRRYPDAEMMMGIGNLTELTDADSAGSTCCCWAFARSWASAAC